LLFISSINSIPGSPQLHADSTSAWNIFLAFISLTAFFVLGFISFIVLFFFTDCMNLFVIATDMLKFSSFSVCFSFMNLRMSGWFTSSIPMFAPLLLPPCFIISAALSNIFMKDMGPDAVPFDLCIMSPSGLIFEKLNPVPPPLWCIIAICFSASNICCIESSIGITKHADNCPSCVPAFISVGEFGRKSRFDIVL